MIPTELIPLINLVTCLTAIYTLIQAVKLFPESTVFLRDLFGLTWCYMSIPAFWYMYLNGWFGI